MAKNKENKGDNVMVIKLSEHKVPQFKEVRGKSWYQYGEQNDYPDYLLTLYDRSAIHNSIVNQKSFYIYGNGSEVADKIKVNDEGETLGEVIKKAILDYELFGGFALEIIWNMAGTRAQIRHANFRYLRTNKDNTKIYFTEDWFKEYPDEYGNMYRLKVTNPEQNSDYKTYNAYNPAQKKGSQIYYYKCYHPNVKTYPIPKYIGAVTSVENDIEISNYWYNATKYGFTASHIITFYGDPGTPEEQKKLEEGIKKKFTGTDKAGNIILNFSANKEKGGSEIANIVPQDLDKQLQILNETVEQKIFRGHRVTSPMLLGIKTPGQLGGRSELREANELWQNTVITPEQKVFGKIFTNISSETLGNKELIELGKLEPIGLDLTTNSNGWAILTEDEQREAVGKPAFTSEQKAQRKAEKDREYEMQKGGQKFSDMKKIPIELFKKYRPTPRKGQLIASRIMRLEDTLNLKAAEHSFSKQNFARLRNKQLAVLDLLQKDNLIQPPRIVEALRELDIDISIEEVNNIIVFLKKRDLLEESKTKSGDGESAVTVRVLTPVKDAVKILEDTPAPTENIFTVYSYELRPEFADWPIDQSRQDCQDLMEESAQRFAAGNLWTREEIELIQTESGLSPWESRGGWMTKKGTDIHVPWCHHIWVQHLYSIEN